MTPKNQEPSSNFKKAVKEHAEKFKINTPQLKPKNQKKVGKYFYDVDEKTGILSNPKNQEAIDSGVAKGPFTDEEHAKHFAKNQGCEDCGNIHSKSIPCICGHHNQIVKCHVKNCPCKKFEPQDNSPQTKSNHDVAKGSSELILGKEKTKRSTLNKPADTLSDKIWRNNVLFVPDIKDFIQKLKEELPFCVCKHFKDCKQCSIIRKLAGKELI